MIRLGALVLVLVAVALPGTAAAATREVSIQGPVSAFQPGAISVDAGDTVHWTNLDTSTHTVTSSSFGSPFLAPGDDFSRIFASSGTFSYYCSIHPEMTGEVTVTGPPPPPPGPPPPPPPGPPPPPPDPSPPSPTGPPPPLSPTLSVANAFTREGNDGVRFLRFAVRLSAPAGEPVRVDYATSNGTAKEPGDYRLRAGTVVFAPGEQLRRVRIAVFGDQEREGREWMRLRLAAPDGAGLARAGARGTILDFD